MNKLYFDLATWWPLLSPPEDYREGAAFYSAQLARACDGEASTLLELGCLPRKLWLSVMGDVGLAAHAEPYDVAGTTDYAGEVFIGRK